MSNFFNLIDDVLSWIFFVEGGDMFLLELTAVILVVGGIVGFINNLGGIFILMMIFVLSLVCLFFILSVLVVLI
jgi:uncharacterized membrane protein